MHSTLVTSNEEETNNNNKDRSKHRIKLENFYSVFKKRFKIMQILLPVHNTALLFDRHFTPKYNKWRFCGCK